MTNCCSPSEQHQRPKIEMTSEFIRTYSGEWIRISTIMSLYVEESFIYDSEERQIYILVLTSEGNYTFAKDFKTQEEAQVHLDAIMRLWDYGKDCE